MSGRGVRCCANLAPPQACLLWSRSAPMALHCQLGQMPRHYLRTPDPWKRIDFQGKPTHWLDTGPSVTSLVSSQPHLQPPQLPCCPRS